MWFTMGETERANRERARADWEKARADAKQAESDDLRILIAERRSKSVSIADARGAVDSARAILKLIIEVRDDAVAADPKRAEYIAQLNAEILRAARNLNDAHTILNRRLTDHINGRQPE